MTRCSVERQIGPMSRPICALLDPLPNNAHLVISQMGALRWHSLIAAVGNSADQLTFFWLAGNDGLGARIEDVLNHLGSVQPQTRLRLVLTVADNATFRQDGLNLLCELDGRFGF